MRAPPRPSGPIAYVTGVYPKVSHTFIQREVASLRRHGADVLTCTIRRPKDRDVVGEDQHQELRNTFCVLDAAKRPHRLVASHVKLLLRRPGRWLTSLRLAARTCPPGFKAMLWQLFYFAEAGVLADHLLRRGAVHLHNHFGDASCTVTMLAAEMADLPFSYTMHGPDLFFEPYKWRIDEKTARARFVVCISHFCRSQAMLFSSPQHWPKLRIVHCGVTPASYGQRNRSGFSKCVFFIGRLDPVKGGQLLLEAFASVYHRHEDARLVIVGDGSARADLEARAASLGIAGAVDFMGFRSQAEVAELLGQADMLVLPSFAEGVPVVLMEAMASRVPTLASRIAGIPELVQDGTTGFLVPPGDVPSLAHQLDVLLSDPDLCARMGVAGRQVVEAEFDVDQESVWLLRLFQSPDPASEHHDGTPR